MSFLKGQVAIVSGAAQGLGTAFAKALAENGARVVAFDVQPAIMDIARTLSRETDGRVIGLIADVASRLDVERVVKTTVEQCGGIDILINNAGKWTQSPVTDPWDKAVADFDQIMDTNVRGLLMLSRACVPHLIQRGGGNIVNLSTYYVLPARSAGTNQPTTDVYNASKWALNGFTEAWALVLADKKIRVNALAMGAVDTPMLRGLFPDRQLPPDLAKGVMQASDIAGQLIALLKEGPDGRTGENIGAWVGYPIELGARKRVDRAIVG